MNLFRVAKAYARARSSWLGAGGEPVPQEQAQHRADVCLTCPKNKPHPTYENLTAPVAAELRHQIELKSNMHLKVNGEYGLHVCEGCWCLNALKIHAPTIHLKQTPLNDLQQSNPRCWLLVELDQK